MNFLTFLYILIGFACGWYLRDITKQTEIEKEKEFIKERARLQSEINELNKKIGRIHGK